MAVSVRPAGPEDIDTLVALLLADAENRVTPGAGLWRLKGDPAGAIRAALVAEAPPFRQQWLMARAGGRAVGVAHSILLPVPPIYAGAFGPPGLIMEDCHVLSDAPPGTREALLAATEADLRAAGAQILLASGVVGGDWAPVYGQQGYDPLTLYLAKTGLERDGTAASATEADLPGIVQSSAVNRRVLATIHPRFWEPHGEADARFGGWMARSLTLSDRDMFVTRNGDTLTGYAISQPATPLHFPAPHDISGIGVIDDFFHDALGDPATPGPGTEEASALFKAAESSRAQRGDHSVLVVCPAGWASKIALLERAGYRNAITWYIKAD